MFKNVASQKIALFAYDSTTGAPKTGDAANITPYVSKDYGTVTVLGTTTATEMDATNAKGWYSFVLTQAETNGDALLFTGKSSTANAFVVGVLIYSDPPNFSTLSVDGSGRVDVGKIGGTAQTARDIGASVITASGTVTTVTNQLTGAAIATAIWQDTTAGDFTTALSVGKSLMNGVALGTGLTVNDITTKTGYSLSGTQTFNVTGNITGNLSGSVGSVTGAVASVTAGVTVSTNNDKTGYTASTVSDKTGYSLTQTFPTNFSATAISAAGIVSADIKKVNAVTVNGDGNATPWGP